MANATLVTQKVQEIHLSNKLEKSGQIQLDSSFSLNVSFSSDGSRCVGKLQQTLRDKEFVGGKFTMTVELVGIFNCSNATTDEVKRQVHGEVYDQLFPYMQSQCASLAAASGVPGLMLRKVPIDPNNIAINKKGGPDNDRNPDGGPKLTLLECKRPFIRTCGKGRPVWSRQLPCGAGTKVLPSPPSFWRFFGRKQGCGRLACSQGIW